MIERTPSDAAITSVRTLLGAAGFSRITQAEADAVDLALSYGVNHIDSQLRRGGQASVPGSPPWKPSFLATKTGGVQP
jgi:hypothetical protein